MSRRFQFSLRALLVALTIACAWLGTAVERAKQQRLAVAAVEAVGGVVQYDWQPDPMSWPVSNQWRTVRLEPVNNGIAPHWLARAFGRDLFCGVRSVFLRERALLYSGEDGKWAGGTQLGQLEDSKVRALIPHLSNLIGLKTIYLQDHQPPITGVVVGAPLTRERITDKAENEIRAALADCNIVHVAERVILTTIRHD